MYDDDDFPYTLTVTKTPRRYVARRATTQDRLAGQLELFTWSPDEGKGWVPGYELSD